MSAPDLPPAAPAPTGYEFSAGQNDVIAPLASAMRWVGGPLAAIGIIYAAMTILYAVQAFSQPVALLAALWIGLAAAFFLALGIWTSRAAVEFGLITTTRGADVSHLMAALDSLRKAYGLLSLIVKVYLILIALAVVT